MGTPPHTLRTTLTLVACSPIPPPPDFATCLADLVSYKAVSEDYVTRINCSQGEGNRQARRSQLEANNVMTAPLPLPPLYLSLPLSTARAEVGIVCL